MAGRQDIRVSDRDRQTAADRLKQAMDEGRLDLFEYDSRLGRAYQAGTYGELEQLFADLPDTAPAAASTPRRRPAPARKRPSVPIALKIVWVVWASIVAISLTTWILVSVGNGEYDTFWPMWLLIPTAMLTAVTVGLQTLRR